MITLARQVQLKLKKFDELMIKLKTKHLDNPVFYSELHKIDERKDEIQKLIERFATRVFLIKKIIQNIMQGYAGLRRQFILEKCLRW